MLIMFSIGFRASFPLPTIGHMKPFEAFSSQLAGRLMLAMGIIVPYDEKTCWRPAIINNIIPIFSMEIIVGD